MNVRSVTIYATLRTHNLVYTKAFVSSDRDSISLSYNGKTSTIALPLGIRLKGSVGFPVSDPAEISLRLEIVEDDQPSHGETMEVGNDSPWPAAHLSSQAQLACKTCSVVIAPPSGRRIWKDLPRGHWAETLDQWYCHRPSGGESYNIGYVGSSGPKLESNVCFVDTCHLLLPAEECIGIKVRNIVPSNYSS